MMQILDNVNKTVKDDLVATVSKGDKVSIAAACFSIYAYEALKKYKLVYIKLLSQKIGYPVPIFCDSPSGREVKKETIIEMLNLLKRDFSKHQIFIASIYKYEEIFDLSNIIYMKGSLFNEPSILDFVGYEDGKIPKEVEKEDEWER